MPPLRECITTEEALEERLSRPTPGTIEAMRRLQGDLLILGVGGKMGPSLARLARRSADAAGCQQLRIIGASRFSDAALRQHLEQDGIQTVVCDFQDPQQRAALPRVPNVIFAFGYKFRHDKTPGLYWVHNVALPLALAEQFRAARIVCFSSGNIYAFTPRGQRAPTEHDPPGPLGEYATTVWGRERVVQYVSTRYETPACLLRLNYAVEARYGVLVDVAQRLLAGEPIPLRVPEVNFVWQAYANAVALQAFAISRPGGEILNVTGLQRHSVRDLAEELGRRLGVRPQFEGPEGPASLLSDARRCHELFGPPELDAEQLMDLVAAWLRAGGRTLGKPTRFEVADGQF
jgi:nucleoside-diphosphate-sugar epimerase